MICQVAEGSGGAVGDQIGRNARLCNICYTYFKRLFAQKYGLTPSRYVAKLRLERGAELLESGQYNVTEVAALCGYDNIYYFSRCFKEAYGVPPSRYPPK
ncbi:MAG: helix-turn-helix transcriptional regulator [Clostridia bacterium]|nr:helix-turn-helix transcriptional regulator [Clostridia bacterium]MBQ4625235.1 helix-turn-helix transcriptional regulator [Clostridia bacterium]